MKLALFGGLYSNYLALEAALDDARARGADACYCLGDLGAFGPHPDRVFPRLFEAGVQCIQGNYDHSLGHGLDNCQCGYTDPRDNHFARISYEYTFANTSPQYRNWMRELPAGLRLEHDGVAIVLCHGSPRQTNEFLWESTTSRGFLEKMLRDHQADVILATHTGLPWSRVLSGGRLFANVGVLGRPANDGTPRVWYAMLKTGRDRTTTGPAASLDAQQGPTSEQGPPSGQGRLEDRGLVDFDLIPVDYEHEQLAAEMRAEHLPEEFVETILTGWWTTCLEILPGKERARGRF